MEQIVPFTDGNSEENDTKLSFWEQIVPFTGGNSEENDPKLSIWEKNCSIYRWEFGRKES